MSIEANIELAKRYCTCMAVQDHKAAEPLLADNFTAFIPSPDPRTSEVKSKREVLDRMARYGAMFGDSDLIIKSITAQDNRVAIEAESMCLFKPNGKTYNNRYHFLFEIENGRITALRDYCDTAHAAEVFGAIG